MPESSVGEKSLRISVPLGSIDVFRFSIIVSLFFLQRIVGGGVPTAEHGNRSWEPRVTLLGLHIRYIYV